MFRTRVVIIFLLLCCAHAVVSQAGYTVRHFSVDDGLADHRVYHVLLHSDGFVYLGTEKGVCRFDGYGAVLIETNDDPSVVPSNGVYGMWELADGSILVRNRLDFTNTDNYRVVDLHTGQSSVVSPVNQGDSVNYVRIGTEVVHTPPSGLPAEVFRDDFGNVLKMPRGNGNKASRVVLHLASGDSLDLSKTWKTLYGAPQVNSHNLAEVIYVATINGLVTIEPKEDVFSRVLYESASDWEYKTICRSMLSYGDTLLISTEEHGLAYVDLETGAVGPVMVTDAETGREFALNNIRGVSTGQEDGEFWISAFFQGLYKLNIKTLVVEGDGISKRDVILTSGRLADSLIVMAIGPRGRGNDYSIDILSLNTGEINRLDLEELERLEYEFRSTFFLESHLPGYMWYGTTNGLFLIDIPKRKIARGYFNKALKGRYDQADFPVHYILSASNVLALYRTTDEDLLIGLEEGGLDIYNPASGTIENLSVEDGLANNTVCGILTDERGYWLSTYNGLTHYDTSQHLCRNFHKASGLPHDEFNRFSFYEISEDLFCFGTMNGAVMFDPERALGSGSAVDIVPCEVGYYKPGGTVHQVRRNGFSPGMQINIPSQNRNFYITLSIDGFRNSAANLYSYRLVKSSEVTSSVPWTFNGTGRTIQYEYLPAGKYSLQVKGVDSEGRSTGVYAINIRVREYFYRTWWFITILLVFTGFLFYIFYRNRLEQAIRVERLRTKLSSDLHDDVGGLLSGVAYQMELLGMKVPDEHKPLVQRIAESSRTAMSRMRDVVWAIDSRNSTFSDMVDRMREYAVEVLAPLDIEFDWQDSGIRGDTVLSAEVRHSLLLIFKEFITNTIKHAEASRIEGRMSRDKTGYKFTMADNGKGWDRKPSTGQGLENMEARVAKIGGTIDFGVENGFRVEIVFP